MLYIALYPEFQENILQPPRTLTKGGWKGLTANFLGCYEFVALFSPPLPHTPSQVLMASFNSVVVPRLAVVRWTFSPSMTVISE